MYKYPLCSNCKNFIVYSEKGELSVHLRVGVKEYNFCKEECFKDWIKYYMLDELKP